MLRDLLPDEPEVIGLLALMLYWRSFGGSGAGPTLAPPSIARWRSPNDEAIRTFLAARRDGA